MMSVLKRGFRETCTFPTVPRFMVFQLRKHFFNQRNRVLSVQL